MVRLKGLIPKEWSKDLTRFQFLMVRLKESIKLQKNESIAISIPYGSIKSLTT